MQNDPTGALAPLPRENQHQREVRAAIDVMFEALSHIQASINADDREDRERQYRLFKEALYERFEQAVEDWKEEALDRKVRSSAPNGNVEESVATGKASKDGDTLETLWPEASV